MIYLATSRNKDYYYTKSISTSTTIIKLLLIILLYLSCHFMGDFYLIFTGAPKGNNPSASM